MDSPNLPYVFPPIHLGQGGQMRWEIVIPTIRQNLPEFAQAMETMQSSITLDTNLHVLNGKAGKAQTLNMAHDEILAKTDRGIYVTMDDDYLPPVGWQERIEAAFAANEKWGALALWFPDDWHERILAERCGEEAELKGIRYRPVPHNIIGMMIAFRRDLAWNIGKLPDNTEKYQMWEDGWRCARVTFLGYEMAYLMGDTPSLIWYSDPKDYIDQKLADMDHARATMDHYMRQGLRKPLPIRILNRLRRTFQKPTNDK